MLPILTPYSRFTRRGATKSVLKFLAKDSLTFDTEFVPDADAGLRMLGSTHPSFVDVPERAQMTQMWQAHNDYDADENPRPFLKPILQKVVSIAAVRRRETARGVMIELKVMEDAHESAMIERFMAGVGGSERMQIVGYNSESCDLPLLVQRALVHNISVPSFCKRPDKPWEGRDLFARHSDYHIDLMHELGGFGRSVPSLSEACAAMNILGGAKDITGADVVDLYLAGDLPAIHYYCAKDAVRQFLILLRLCVLAGHVSADHALYEEATVVQQLEAFVPLAAPLRNS
jgi:3'-5' exonuclease